MAWTNSGNIRGPVGATGPAGSTGASGSAATVAVGTVTTGTAGSSASVTNSGSSSAAVLDFVLVRGDTGPAGSTGATGAAGTTTWAGITDKPGSILNYIGLWNASTNSPTLSDSTGSGGDVYRVSTGGTRNLGSGNITFDVGDYVIFSGSAGKWEKADTTDAVSSVAGRTGDVTLTKSDVGLGSVDNTADSAKNVATAATLTTARNFQTDLASTSAASFNGSANVTPGVTGTLAVPNGGTGVTSITANGVVVGGGTGAVSTVAPGTSGNVLTSNGTAWTSAASAAASTTLDPFLLMGA